MSKTDVIEVEGVVTDSFPNAMFEVVVHDFTKQEARHYLDTLHRFFVPGWRALLGL